MSDTSNTMPINTLHEKPSLSLVEVALAFCPTSNAKNISVTPHGEGLINNTFLVTTAQQKFVLQKINAQVFPKPLEVIDNANLISKHLTNKSEHGEYPFTAINQLKVANGNSYLLENGNYWRALNYVENCFTIQAVESAEQAGLAANAFANFTGALSDFDANQLHEIIPNFHHLDSRINQLKLSKNTATEDRKATASQVIEFCLLQQEFIEEVAKITEQLPLHVTHNDTKINNLLFDNQTKGATAVIDLDTCMPGFLMNDFGDMVRTCCGTLAEDAKNIGQMSIRIDVFEALANAYVSGFIGDMTKLEKQSLVVGALLLPFMIGVRFLTDYLNEDIYFHTQYSEHNLDRAKNQFKLYQLLAENRSELTAIINNIDK